MARLRSAAGGAHPRKWLMAIAALVRRERIEQRVLRLRGQTVILDKDLAALYGVSVRELNQAVKRNPERFPADFMFRLTARETRNLRSQIVISSLRHGGRRYTAYAFTELGVAMLSSVLRSARAVRVNIEIMRTFVVLRRVLESHGDLAAKIDELQEEYDHKFVIVFQEIRKLMTPPRSTRSRIGFRAG
jgi:hypothetical protein